MTPEPTEFGVIGDDSVSVWLSPYAITTMLTAANSAGRRETGGILIGRYSSRGWIADVVEATPKPKGSRSGWFWFQRSSTGLATLLEERWRNGLHYLGEWHSHPGGQPVPSGLDIRAMRAIACDGSYCCPAPILVILGSANSIWSFSATLFREGQIVDLERCPRKA
jgi:proteasome lid subunit RPN8/RPN11